MTRYLPGAWAVLLPVLLLGPALGVGYVLTYDMVWVPDLALRSDFLGLGTGLPRAVPSDAVVSVLDTVLSGMLLQKLVLLGGLVLAGFGILRLVDGTVAARCAAVSVFLWNPFVVERLWIGHWPVLLGYAVLPWLVLEGARLREGGRVGPRLLLLLPLGCLSASTGLMSSLALLVPGLSRRDRRRGALMVLLCLAANAPWLVTGLLHVSDATSSGAGSVFGLGDEGSLPGPVMALTLGGIWNAEVVPGSRGILPTVVLATAAVLAAAAYGFRPLRRRLGARTCGSLVALWVVGYAVALSTWAAPGAAGWVASHVPGGGLLRDGSRALALCAPLTAALVAAAVERLAAHWHERGPRVLVAVTAALLPLALLPDVAWGLGRNLHAVSYPDDYSRARESVVRSDADGDLLVLPFTAYRAPAWNDGRKVLDPTGRFLTPDYLASDQLSVSGRVLAGEDPRVPAVLAALRLPDPAARAERLGELGIGLVVREHGVTTTPEYDAPVAGTTIHDGPELDVVRLDVPVHRRAVPVTWWVAAGIGWLAFLALPLAALLTAGWRRRPVDAGR
ncbi:hypothetical protein GCM10009844_37020 [Nocardioides koreensis]|uniref:YfhO family protein n=1 Tax=Nocardioides koreensis TaxID=433651 RepID=A0ABN3A3A9_9ACTN